MIIFFNMYIVPFLLSLILHSVWTKLLQIILFHWYLFVFCIFYLFCNIFCETVFYILNFGESNRKNNFWLTVWKRWFSGKRYSERLIIGLLTIIMILTKNWRMNILHIIRDGHKELNHSIVHYIYRKLNHAIFEHIKSNLMLWIQCLQRFCSQFSNDRRM